MRKLLLWVLFFLIPFLYSIYVSAQSKKEKDCSTTCFSSEVVSVQDISETCKSYELKVSYSGVCAHALSHLSVAVPCGTVENIWNSANWSQEIGTDPTTGLQGFKIDNIGGFGEGLMQHFTVKFNVCASGECTGQMLCWQPQVAYKASTCVNYETLPVTCQSLEASLQKTDISCFNAKDGSLAVVVAKGQGPYTFSWSNAATTESISNLDAGTYSVVVRDQSGDEVTLEGTITQPKPITVSGNATSASCNGMANGSIDVSVSGGRAPYIIEWTNGSHTEDLHDVAPGQYSVIVKDANNCSTSSRFTVGSQSVMDITASLVKPDCNDSNGSIDISVTGGTQPYSFNWSDNIVSQNRTGIAAGIYSVVVTDSSGCTASASFFIKENNTLRVDATTTPASCVEDSGGGIDLTVTGGAPGYTYSWSNGATDEDLLNTGSGYYTVKVTDEKNCTVTQSYAVPKNTFQVPRTVQQPACHDEANGSITLQDPIGGTGPFSYVWSVNNETGTMLTGLGEGMYSVTVTDATGCSRTLTSTIKNPPEIFVSATITNAECHTEGSMSIDLSVSGGTAPYAYQWSNGSTAEDLSGLASGTYTVTVTDAHGCSVSKDIIVEEGSAAWSCLITQPDGAPICGSTSNTLSTNLTDAESYLWAVESSNGGWSISNPQAPSIIYIAGSESSTATFTLIVVKDGCTKTCSYTVSSCVPDDTGGDTEPGGEEPGSEDPDDENPDEEEPGEDNGDENNEGCATCFESAAKLISAHNECRTYEIEVTTNGQCRHELSHWTLSIPCGSISNYSNSEGWKMEVGQDPTTGLYGLKVDGVAQFGKTPDSFTVRFTVCQTGDCNISSWSPTVAYKAGQCVENETTEIIADPAMGSGISVYPNPFNETINFEWHATNDDVTLQIIDQYGNTMSAITSASRKADAYYVTLESTSLPKGMYYYRLTLRDKVYQGKISKK